MITTMPVYLKKWNGKKPMQVPTTNAVMPTKLTEEEEIESFLKDVQTEFKYKEK